MIEAPLVTFVGVNYKTPHLYRHVMQAVLDARLPFDYEFFLVDNATDGDTVARLRERFPWVTFLPLPTNRGLGGGLNAALEHARGRYVVYLNPDLIIFPGELERWIAWMELHPDVGISAPRIVNPDRTDQDSCYRFPRLITPFLRRTWFGSLGPSRRHIDWYLMRGMDRSKEQDVDWALGAALAIRADLLAKIGRFDERFFLYFEDTDLCRRAWMAGSRVAYTPAATFVHYHQRQSRTRFVWEVFTNRVARIHLISGIKYFLKYLGKPNPREKFEKSLRGEPRRD